MSEDTGEEFGKNVPMKRRGQRAEPATAYAMLAYPLSSYVSGATNAVTGGKRTFLFECSYSPRGPFVALLLCGASKINDDSTKLARERSDLCDVFLATIGLTLPDEGGFECSSRP
jgi:hypothetical protein